MPDLDTPRPPGPPCGACGQPAVVQWLRRPSDAETDALHLADGSTIAIHACPGHAITAALAGRIHAATCAAPALDAGCTCTPEQPVVDPFEPTVQPELPVGW
ncbi:MAG: hypothetical protein HOV92_09350 [Streptomyces sp.]|nr:hypothetical protein [Streptomyces sp.]